MTVLDEGPIDVAPDVALKAKHRAVWEMGDYPAVAAEVIPDLGAMLVDACGVHPGDTVLDVACGSGNVAIPAALRGARVTACDLTPALLEAGRRIAEERGAEVEWREADAEALPFGDGEFDAVLSCVGAMFAPHHQATADQLVRVCRPGGTIALVNWTPEGFVGQMFAVMKPYVPAPPLAAEPPPLWGDENHVRALFGNAVTDVTVSRQMVTVDCFDTPGAFVECFKAYYGPTVAAYRGLVGDADRVAALDDELRALARRHDRARDKSGGTVMDWEYLLVTARRVETA